MAERIMLTKGADGSYSLGCGCRFDYWDGAPSVYPTHSASVFLKPGESMITGVVAPHVHTCEKHSGTFTPATTGAAS